MIGTIDIAVNAANPQLPLTTLAAYVSSPSHVRVLNVPRGIGAWQLTAVALEIAYPDGAVVSVPATRNGAVWSATFPAPVAPGVSTRGFRVVASGVDENGAAVTGYILGMGDVLILDADGSLVIGDRRVAVRIVETKPESPREGDLVLATMEIFDGTAWRTLGPTPDIGDLTRVEPYLYEINNAALDDTFAEAYFRERLSPVPRCVSPAALPSDVPAALSPRGAGQNPSPLGACSCVRIMNEFARAYDWKYDESVSFLVRTKASGTRFASIAVCRSPEGLTRQAVESKTAATNLFRAVPFYALDGINENGVTCCVNVVPANADGASAWSGRDFCAVGAVRRVLDRARTAEEGATLIATGAWMPSPVSLGGYSLHFMIADGSKTYVVEDGQIFDISSGAVKAMTNFRVGGRDFLDDSGRVDVDKIAEYDPYGTGAERYDELVYRTLHPFAESIRKWLTAFKYSDAYFLAETPRPDDFAGVEIKPGVRARINDTLDLEEWFVANNIHAKWLDRTRDGTFWQTVHSSVYDIAARSLQLVVQEGDAVHTFPIVKSDSEPADYPTVRQNAATGAAHAAETDNPHGTTAEQVGVRVVELVVEGDAKKLYLMSDGERTSERVTSYAALLAMAKRGLVRLYYNAVGGTGRKALYTAHMVDDNGTPAMRFDATGTLGEKVYTRSIALTKSGADGIAVTIGELTEIAKASELAKKVDAQGGAVGKVGSNPSIGVNVNGRYIAIQMSNGSIPTIIYTDDHGAQHYAELQMNKDGTLALTSDIASATKLTPVTVDGKTTAYTLGADTIKKLMAGTTADLPGITAQDIEDYKHYKGVWSGSASVRIGDVLDDGAGDLGRYWRSKVNADETDTPAEGSDQWTLIYAKNDGKTGLEKLIYLFGSENAHLGQTISRVAEASSRYKVVAADKDVADRSIKVYDLTVEGASLPSQIPLPDFPTDSVIDCEVWIVAGSTAPTDVTYGKTIYPRGGEGLTYEANATTIVHLTAVAGQSYYTAVAASFKAQV